MRICFVVADVTSSSRPTPASTWRWPRTGAATTCASSPSTTCRSSTTTTCWRRPRACAPATTPNPADYARALASDEAVDRGGHAGQLRRRLPALQPHPRGRGRARARRSSTSAGACGWPARWWSTIPRACAAPAAACTWPTSPPTSAPRTLVSRSKTPAQGVPARARRARGAQAAGAARRRARLLRAPPPGLEPEPDHRRRHQGRLRHRAGVPARGRAGREAPAAAQRRADPRRQAGRDLPAAPPRWSARAAARAGGPPTRGKCDFGPVEARICDILRPKLLADGLYFVGVDIVGDRILELNVFTPGGIHSIHELYGIDVGRHRHPRPRAPRPPARRLPHDVRSRSRRRRLAGLFTQGSLRREERLARV